MHAVFGVSDSSQHADTPLAAHSDAGNEDDAIDLLMLHFAQPTAYVQAELGSCESAPAPASSTGDCSIAPSPALLTEASSPSSGHQSSSGGTEHSAAALLSWLDELISCLWSMSAFHQSVLLVLLLSNSSKPDVQVLKISKLVCEFCMHLPYSCALPHCIALLYSCKGSNHEFVATCMSCWLLHCCRLHLCSDAFVHKGALGILPDVHHSKHVEVLLSL